MEYTFKTRAELIWFILTVIGTVLYQAVVVQGGAPPDDWKAWATGVLAAAIRPILGGLFHITGVGKAAAS